MKKIENEMVSLRSDIKLNREYIVKKLTEDTHTLNQEVSSIRTSSNTMEIEFQKVKAEMEQRQGELDGMASSIRKEELIEK